MGIQGLLPFTSDASTPCGIKELREKGVRAVAIDSYCWLHRALAAVASPHIDEIKKNKPHVKYCLKYIYMLLSHNIKPILVFDGRRLPAKAITEEKRRESRKLAKQKAAEFLKIGKINEARSYIRRSIDITHDIALDVIQECRKINVDCIVAPYEADAQLAYLNKINIVQVVITEDSDLILFGCDKIFFKMDLNGNGILLESAKLPIIMKCPLEKYSFEKFRRMCILSGCDYLPSLPGIGLAKARQFMNVIQNPSIINAIKKMPIYFNKLQMQVTDDYCEGFLKAEATFKHQYVYDPIKKGMVRLTDLDDEESDLKYCCNAGELLNDDIAFQLAIGNLDPLTLNKMDNWYSNEDLCKYTGKMTKSWDMCSIAQHNSIWQNNYSDHLKLVEIKKKSISSAFTIPNTRPLQTKVINTDIKISSNDGLSIEDLSAMYCEKTIIKKRKLDLDEFNNSKILNLSDISNNNDDALFSDDIKNETPTSVDEKISPILHKSNRTYKRLKETGSFSNLQKISKFQRTVLNDEDLAQSKFFENSMSEYLDENESEKNNLRLKTNTINVDVSSVTDFKTDFNSICKKNEVTHVFNFDESSIDENIDNRRLTNENTDWLNTSKSSNVTTLQLRESFSYIDKKSNKNRNPFKKNEESHSEINNDELNKSNIEESQNCDIEPKPLINKHSHKTIKINESNKKLNGLCKRPGLNKNKPVNKSTGQMSLTSFGFQKKSQLQH